MSDLGNPVRIKYLPWLAFNIARQGSTMDKAIKPPGKNWAQGFEKRHPALKPRRVRAIDWDCHENNIYDKITHWFEVIGKELLDPAIVPENVYNMDKTGAMLRAAPTGFARACPILRLRDLLSSLRERANLKTASARLARACSVLQVSINLSAAKRSWSSICKTPSLHCKGATIAIWICRM